LDAGERVAGHSFSKGFPVDLIRANAVSDNERVHIRLLYTGAMYIYDFAAPVLVAGERIGTVRVGFSKARIATVISQLVSTIAMIFGGVLFVALALGGLFSRTVTRRLTRLRRRAEELVHNAAAFPAGTADDGMINSDTPPSSVVLPVQGSSDHGAGTDKLRFLSATGDEIHDLSRTFQFMERNLRTYVESLQEAQHKLSAQKRLLTTVLDVNPDLISLVDVNMVYQTGNLAFAQSVGRTVPDLQGVNGYELFSRETAERRVREGREVLRSGRRFDQQERSDDGRKWFRVVQIPVRDASGQAVGVLRMDQDITEIKIYEQQLIQAQKMESIGKLAGGVAHEINTPLGIILGYAQLLGEDAPPGSSLAEDLAIIERQAKVCRKIVADLLGFSRQTESEKCEMCFNNSVMEAVSLVRHAFALDRVRIVTRLDDSYPIIYGDPEKLKQVWLNLLTNARDAMNGRGGVILIRTQLRTAQGVVTLHVADNGPGIDTADIKNIFDPFFTTKAVGQGTGLGLAVSFGIVKDHMGEIRVESPPTEKIRSLFPPDAPTETGSLFTVDIPLDHCKL
jgi:PAS domain S-box-containing protein